MFNIGHPDDYIARFEAERARRERRQHLARALRGATPPFNEATEEELRVVMRNELRILADRGT